MNRFQRYLPLTVVAALGVATTLLACAGKTDSVAQKNDSQAVPAVDTVAPLDSSALHHREVLLEDSIELVRADSASRYSSLTEADFKFVADELDIEVAAIKAVVSIEAGSKMKGFWAPGVPVLNYDASMWKIYGKKGSGKGDKNAKVPAGLSGYAKQEWTLLTNARKKNVDGANMSAFWGMFQIGGFNYKRCGCSSVQEFVDKMSYSEFEQLQLFAIFIKNTGYVDYIRKKDWTSFARHYNGKSYAKRGYHTKMAAAYKKFKNQK